ncbi:MAG: hypothetical protein ING36_05500 [Burkholderiales bacterium]|jgi:hypothetical protein|nr:hypothetical protein [Rhodocyclaceae bacterium]MCA3167242.1 hypothetical protein [Burkholderiales bacterium]MCA3174991.1 hypothetical protein [Burkholderiales bacterium]
MDREETTRRLELLLKRIRDGKFHVAPHLRDGFEMSLRRIRTAPDGLVDETTVDGRIRSTLLLIAYQADREEWKDLVSLKQIQEAYFDRLHKVFGQPYQMMLEAKVDPYHFAKRFASKKGRVAEAIEIFDDFVLGTIEFWENISDPTWIHLEDSFDSKAVFTGEIFPDGRSNVVSSTGIYFDTTVLPDPFLKIAPLLSHMDEQDRLTEILRLGLQVLQYRELAIADVPKPLVAVLPDRHGLEESYRKFVNDCASDDTVKHAKRLFGRDFADVEELEDYLKHFKTSADIVGVLRQPDELVFATEWDGSLADHIDRFIRENGKTLGITVPGQAVFLQLLTRFSQANDSYQRSRELRGTPIVRAVTSWMWFNWMLRANAQELGDEALTGLHIARALGTTVKSEISWLGNVPPAALIEIRKTGALDEIRALLGTGIKELVVARPENFHRTGDKVFDNLYAAFNAHEQQLDALRMKKWKFAGLDVGSFLVVGGIEMAAALTGLPLFGAAAATASRLGVIPTAKELKTKFGKLKAEDTKLNSTGVGILFKHGHRDV